MKKHLIRAAIVSTLVAGAFGISAGSPANASHGHRDLCQNEAMPGDVGVHVGSTAFVGVDTGTAGLVGVPVVCANVNGTPYGGGGGATVTPGPGGVTIQPYTCSTTACNDFLVSVFLPV